jgi:hypothetical protein
MGYICRIYQSSSPWLRAIHRRRGRRIGRCGQTIVKMLSARISIPHHPSNLSADSLPTFALFDHAFDPIHGTIGTGDLSISCNMVSLHDVASDFSSATSGAGLCGPSLDEFRRSIRIKICGRLGAFLGARIGGGWGMGMGGIVVLWKSSLGSSGVGHDDGGHLRVLKTAKGSMRWIRDIGGMVENDEKKKSSRRGEHDLFVL